MWYDQHRAGAEEGRKARPCAIEPWAESVNGAELLNEAVKEIRRYVIMPTGMAEIVALWSVHTHCFDHFMHSPRLAIVSPEKGCEKTTLLDVLGRLVARPLLTSNATAAAIFRVVEQSRPTLLIDEADTFLKGNDELRGILNSGHRKAGAVIRTVGDGHEPRQFSTWSPASIAMMGRLPDTLNDRSIVVTLYRRKPSERVQSFRFDRADLLDVLARKVARWVIDNSSALKVADPDMGNARNRVADNWRALLTIADAVGGEWPKRAREIMVAADKGHNELSVRIALLTDIKAAFEDKKTDRLASEDVATHLGGLEERP